MPETAARLVRVGHSPDADDAFMFHALTSGAVAAGGLEFEHVLLDIETLNRRAAAGEFEVSAVSIHAFPDLADRYWLMNCGASMGEGYGPVVVARGPATADDLRGRRLAVPGLKTSAYLVARLWLGDFEPVVVPFDEVMAAVADGRAEAGVVIHEGQLTYRDEGFERVCDLGVWWGGQTGLPLPLGGNIVRKDLGRELAEQVTDAVRRSIEYALAHRAAALDGAMVHAGDLSRRQADRFVGMYVNERTIDYGPEGRRAVGLLLERAVAAGLVADVGPIEFIGCPAGVEG